MTIKETYQSKGRGGMTDDVLKLGTVKKWQEEKESKREEEERYSSLPQSSRYTIS